MNSSQATSPRKLSSSTPDGPSVRERTEQKQGDVSLSLTVPKISSRTPISPPTTLVPKLKLPKVDDGDGGTPDLASMNTGPIASSLPLMKLPSARNSERGTAQANDQGQSPGRTNSVLSPRGESARSSHVISPARRQRLGSSPQQLISPRAKKTDSMPDVLPSPRGANTQLMTLGDEAATQIFAALKKSKTQLTPEVIDALARQDTPVSMHGISTALRAKLNPERGENLSHSQLVKALFMPSLLVTDVGKTLVAMRKMVMMQYDGESLTLEKRLQIEQSDLGFKDRMQANLEQQAKACAAVALGRVGSGQLPSLAASKLPAELIAFWKSMDRQLCEWASENPALDSSQLRKARENLGFDILFTRLVLPVALGSSEESHLVIPMMFYEAVKNALKADWSAFMDSFIADTQTPISHASTRSTGAQGVRAIPTTATTATTATATAASTTDTSLTRLQTPPGQGTEQST